MSAMILRILESLHCKKNKLFRSGELAAMNCALCSDELFCAVSSLAKLANFAAMDCLPVFMVFFCANARSFWGVAAGELCSDGLSACFHVFLVRMCGLFGVLQRWTACLLHFIIWQECQLQHLIIFFLAGTLTAH